MNIYLQCILAFERVAVMGLDNVCVLFSEVTVFFCLFLVPPWQLHHTTTLTSLSILLLVSF